MALTENPTTNTPEQIALLQPHIQHLRDVQIVQPRYSFKGNDCVTVLDVHLPGVRRTDVSLRLIGQHILIIGKCFAPGKRELLRPYLRYVLQVQLVSPIDRNAVKAVMRGFDTLRVTIPTISR